MSKKLNEKANSILARVKADDPAADPAEENEEQTTTTETPTDGEGSGETETPAEETPAEETPVETTTETEHPVDPSDPEPKKKTAEVEEEVVEETEEEVVDDSDLEDEVDELRQLVDDLIDRMENLQRQFDENVSAILKGKTAVKSSIAKALSGAPASNAPADWPSAIKDCNGDRLQAFKRFPNLAKVWNKNH